MNKTDTAYKSIGEVAKLLNLINKKNGSLNTHTIRFWEKEFKQIKPKIFSGRRRYYDTNSIEILKQIKHLLKDQGLTIKGVKKLLDKNISYENVQKSEKKLNLIDKKNIKNKLNKISNLLKEIKNLK